MSLALAQDTYENTVLAMWEKLLPRLDLQQNSVDFLTSCSSVVNIITNYLWLRKSDLLRETVSTQIFAESNQITLPDGFLALDIEPTLEVISTGVRTRLTNLPEERRYSDITDVANANTPQYFDLVGKQINVYPFPDEDVIVYTSIFKRPDVLTRFDSLLPFDGLFDDIIADAAFKMSNVGYMILQDASFISTIQTMVDRIINMRTKKTIAFRMV